MEKTPQGNKEMFLVGHLDDVDDLKTYGRNGPVANTEKNKLNLNIIVDNIVKRVNESNKKAVMFVTSPRRRSKETAILLGHEINKKLGDGVKIRYAQDDNLKSTEQGELLVPDNYTPGSFFEGLDIASRIFIDESQGNNLNYRFGDPVLLPDGSHKYPELIKYFKEGGETYAESLSRIFSSIVELSKKVHKLNLSTEVVVIYHGFNFNILRGLVMLGIEISTNGLDVKPGDILFEIRKIYKAHKIDFKSPDYYTLDISSLGDKDLIARLDREIEYLKNIVNK